VAAAAWGRRLGIDAGDLETGLDEPLQRGHREIGSAEKGETHPRHVAADAPTCKIPARNRASGMPLEGPDIEKALPMLTRTFVTAGAIGLLLAVGACSKADQQKTNADAQAAAGDVKAGAAETTEDVKAQADKLGADIKKSAKESGNDLKAIAKDPEVKKAAHELKGSLKDLGSAVKDASKKTKDSASDATDEAKK
jgi:hypothetical protein